MKTKHIKTSFAKLILLTILSISLLDVLSAQEITPKILGFDAHQLSTTTLGEVNYYISESANKEQKPLLVYLDGSGPYPLFQKFPEGVGSSVVINFQELKKDYRILLISKPGIPFIDKMTVDSTGFPIYEAPEEYAQNLSLNWRVESANAAINELIDNGEIDTSMIAVLGFSEGAQVAPRLAVKNKHISHILLFGGNGLNQFFDALYTARMKAASGETTQEIAQQEVDSLFKVYQSIYEDPKDTKRTWWGHSYLRWASFTESAPYQDLLQLDIPIYMANGSLDENTVLSADYIQLEFIRKRKNNLTYKTYVNYDHQFNLITQSDDITMVPESKLTEVLNDAFKWLTNQ